MKKITFTDGFQKQPDGCWLWTSQPSARYPHVRYNGESQPVHRVAFQLNGGDLSDGLKVLHRCDVTRCVNPDHLFKGTQAENMKDMGSKGRHGAQRNTREWMERLEGKRSSPGESNGAAKLTQQTVAEIRASGLSLGGIVKQFGISKSQASRIKNLTSWK